jgi:flagellar biosynthesis/type III secretory pathway chaperone
MNPALALQQNLDAQHDCAQQLLGLLGSERNALLANDVAALEDVTASKAQAADRMAGLGHSLERLRSGSAAASVDALIAHAGAEAARERWNALATLAEQCLQANQANAALLSSRQQQIRAALRVLQPATNNDQTYGRGGHTGFHDGPRLLGQA